MPPSNQLRANLSLQPRRKKLQCAFTTTALLVQWYLVKYCHSVLVYQSVILQYWCKSEWCTGNGQFGNQRGNLAAEKKTLNFAFVATNRTTYRASKCSRIHFEKVLVKCIVKSVANLIWVGC